MGRGCLLGALLAVWSCVAAPPQPDVREIIRRSVSNTNTDWDAAPRFDFMERDVIGKNGRREARTFQVLMIEGSPYNKLVAVAGQPLTRAQAAEEDRKLERVKRARRRENSYDRSRRVAEYHKERKQDFELMQQMAAAFDYRLAGEETVDGHLCYVLVATPKPGYQPINRDTRVLKGMRGKMWIDEQQLQWVKVQAEVFRPVSFGLFIAHVEPGTEFTLEQKPATGNLWLPAHFSVRVRANVLLWQHNSTDDETYWDYRRAAPEAARVATR